MPEQQRVVIERNIEIPMRDGSILRADAFRPDDDLPHPVLLNRTPYNKQGIGASFNAVGAAGEGYIVMSQDCRGRFSSDGVFYPFLNESEDGYDTIEWIASQPWCDGKVGMFGVSYMGATQWLAAIAQPPHLVTIVPGVTASDYHEGWTYQSGAFLLGFNMSWTLLHLTLANLAKLNIPAERLGEVSGGLVSAVDDAVSSYSHLPLKDYPLLKDAAPYYYDWLEHPNEDKYWKRWKIEDFHQKIKIPVFNVGGWYDIFLGGTLRNYTGMRESGGSPEARSAGRLVVGPWLHGAPLLGQVSGDIDFGVGASAIAYGLDPQVLSWFDHWLKGAPNGITDTPPVSIFAMGVNQWRQYDQWPPPGVENVAWYFHSQGRANGLDGDGSLSPQQPADAGPDCYVYDPRNPVPTKGGGLCCDPTMSRGGAYDQRPMEARDDVLLYTSEPLQKELEVTGPLQVKLWASSSAVDTDFTAKLVDVHPNGYAQNLVDNLVRARFRDSLEKPSLIEPGKPYEYTIDLHGTSNVFKAGHRIRVEISSSNFPRFDRNPNTGGVIAEETQLTPALQTVFHDRNRPSHIVLPVMRR